MDFFLSGLRQYSQFSGRTARLDYWMFGLINILIMLVLEIASGSLIAGIYSLIVLIPSLAIFVRRLHDIDHSAWWILIILLPIIGFIVLFIFTLMRGSAGDNRFGPNPECAPDRSVRSSAKMVFLIIAMIIFGFILSVISSKNAIDEISQEVKGASVTSMKDIYDQVSTDAVSSYELSVKGGDPVEICVQAGLVVAAYNQAHDEASYLHWKNIERQRCATAGIPN